MDASKIHPKLKPSYSPNLHKFVRRWNFRRKGLIQPEVWADHSDGSLWIGYQDSDKLNDGKTSGFIGSRLVSALCVGAKAEIFWHTKLGIGNMTNIPDFWERYIQIGRCAIDTKHEEFFINSDERYILNRNIRTCTWCGTRRP